MAVEKSPQQDEAVSSGRRLAIGANVAIAVVAAGALLVAVNWFCSIKHVRRDLATLGGFGLSDRTKSVLDERHGDLAIWMVYPPDDEDDDQRGHIERLREYFDELTAYAPDIEVTHVATDSQREKLVVELSSALGGEADAHKAALAAFDQALAEADEALGQRLTEARTLIDGESWLGDFPLFAEAARMLSARKTGLKKTQEEIDELIPTSGIPKYADATGRAKTTLGDLKRDLEAVAQFLDRLTPLADEASRPDSPNIAMLREVAAEPERLIGSLRRIVGAQEAPPPADPAKTLKAYVDRGVEVRKELTVLIGRIDGFKRLFPIVARHPDWTVMVRRGPFQSRMELAAVLENAGATLARNRLQILGLIDAGKSDELTRAVATVRQDVAGLEQNASVAKELLTRLAGRLTSLDAGSRSLLDQARGGDLFKDRVAAITVLEKQLDELPELKLGSVADQLKQDNIVVVRVNDRVRVVSFQEVFPLRESVVGPAGGEESNLGHVFNGDSALSSAILALMRDHPFATVVLVSFEPPPPPQQNPFSRPPTSWVPTAQLSELRKRLESANFKVVDWNLATTDEAPPPEEGTENVYVLLPPPPAAMQNPFNRNPIPPRTFGDPERRKILEILENDGRALFVATWEYGPGSPFGGRPVAVPYRYAPILETWGITVETGIRLLWLEPEPSRPNGYSVVTQRFRYMPAGGFTDHVLGKPLRGTRFLVNDACPIRLAEDEPEGVTRAVVQRIMETSNHIAAPVDEIIRIVDTIQAPASDGIVSLDEDVDDGPFNLMVVAERRDSDVSKGKIAVMSFGTSLSDYYLTQPVVRPGEKLRFDAPPTENVDLMINALHWLQGQERWISRGPVPKPTVRPIPKSHLTSLRVLVWGAWPVAVFVPGIVFWYVRRR